jgi:hypothetical protein
MFLFVAFMFPDHPRSSALVVCAVIYICFPFFALSEWLLQGAPKAVLAVREVWFPVGYTFVQWLVTFFRCVHNVGDPRRPIEKPAVKQQILRDWPYLDDLLQAFWWWMRHEKGQGGELLLDLMDGAMQAVHGRYLVRSSWSEMKDDYIHAFTQVVGFFKTVVTQWLGVTTLCIIPKKPFHSVAVLVRPEHEHRDLLAYE